MQHFKVSSSKILGYNVMHLKWEIPWIFGVFYVLLHEAIWFQWISQLQDGILLRSLPSLARFWCGHLTHEGHSVCSAGITMEKAERVRHDNIIPHDSHMDTLGGTNGYIIINTIFPSNRSLRYMAHVPFSRSQSCHETQPPLNRHP